MKRLSIRFHLIILLLCAVASQLAFAQDDTEQSATWLLSKCTMLQPEGGHHTLLRWLRQMRDPELQPFFRELTNHQEPAMQYHGILGLAELSDPPQLDLALFADIAGTSLQGQILTSAILDDLITPEQCMQIYQSTEYELPVRMLVAGQLEKLGQLTDLSHIAEAEQSDNPAMLGMFALLRAHHGDSGALSVLHDLRNVDDPNIDYVQMMLLDTAMTSKFQVAGSWAMALAKDTTISSPLSMQALKVALRFSQPDAQSLWKQRFEEARDRPADRVRLIRLAMDAVQSVDPQLFASYTSDPDPLIAGWARVAVKIASGQSPNDPFTQLLEVNHAISNPWALAYAKDLPPDQTRPLLTAIILAAENDPSGTRNRSQRFDHCVRAVQHLLANDPASHALIKGLLGDVGDKTQRAMLLGILQSNHKDAGQLIAGISCQSEIAQSLALLIRARAGEPLSDEELGRLSLIVRGGGGLRESLRLQAGWMYLKRIGRQQAAIDSIFPHARP